MTIEPYNVFAAVTPNDSVAGDFPTPPAALYIGGAGNLAAVMGDNTVVTFSGLAAGTILPIKVRRVNATLTTATLILALFKV